MNKKEASRRLFEAAETGDLIDAQAALDAGADVAATFLGNITALHVAAYNGRADIAKLLIENGADINAKNTSEETPCDWALARQRDIAGIVAFWRMPLNSRKPTPRTSPTKARTKARRRSAAEKKQHSRGIECRRVRRRFRKSSSMQLPETAGSS